MTQEEFYARLDSLMDDKSTFDLIPPLITQAKADGLYILLAFQENEKGESIQALTCTFIRNDKTILKPIKGFHHCWSCIDGRVKVQDKTLFCNIVFHNTISAESYQVGSKGS